MNRTREEVFDLCWDGVWIAIPAYNEARTIRSIAMDALTICPRVIVVNDGSCDGTATELRDLPITLITHQTNLGKAACIRTAFNHALSMKACCVITIDGDGQHDPADAVGLLAAWQRQPNHIAIGSRLQDRAKFPPARYYANRFACFWISWAAGHPIADSQSGFRIYPRQVILLALDGRVRGHGFTFESEILIEAAQQGYLTLAMSIPGRFPTNARPSHFRPVIDIAKIVIMVAGRLLRQGMSPLRLWRSMGRATVLPRRAAASQRSTSRDLCGNARDTASR